MQLGSLLICKLLIFLTVLHAPRSQLVQFFLEDVDFFLTFLLVGFWINFWPASPFQYRLRLLTATLVDAFAQFSLRIWRCCLFANDFWGHFPHLTCCVFRGSPRSPSRLFLFHLFHSLLGLLCDHLGIAALHRSTRLFIVGSLRLVPVSAPLIRRF